jgi:hypothetical protein
VEIIVPARAEAGYIMVEKTDKAGRRKLVKDEILPSYGAHSAKEMEREMRAAAQYNGYSEDQIRVQAYEHGEAPMTANPRHRVDHLPRSWSGFGESKLLNRKDLPQVLPETESESGLELR